MRVALVHDYLTQRGGAERVVLSLVKAFPGAPLYTSLFQPAETFPEFGSVDVRPSPLNRVRALRRDHRRAFPLLAPAMSRLDIDADVVVCSSSGWAHVVDTEARKVVYCHAPARWLYQTDRYAERLGRGGRAALAALAPALRASDLRAARLAARYLANSNRVAALVKEAYGLEAEVVPPPPALTPGGEDCPVADLEAGFFLCVSRLMPYKNVDEVAAAFGHLPGDRLVVVGTGPDEEAVRRQAGPNVRLLGRVEDAQLRWLYANCAGVVSAAFEDFGLTPLEAAAFGKPAAVLRFGGFLDTLDEGNTGVFFDEPRPRAIAVAVAAVRDGVWSTARLCDHAERFSEARFIDRVREIVALAAAEGTGVPEAA